MHACINTYIHTHTHTCRLLADHSGVETEANDLYLLSSIKGKDRFRTGMLLLELCLTLPTP